MYCPKCGSQQRDDASFCNACGAQLASSAAASPQAPVEPQQQSKRSKGTLYASIIAAALAVVAIVAVVLLVPPMLSRDVAIDEPSFPDDKLRSLVSIRFDIDGNGKLDADEIASVTELDIDGVGDLKGIESFDNLQKVTINNPIGNQVTLPALPEGTEVVIPNDEVVIFGLEDNPWLKEYWLPTSCVSEYERKGRETEVVTVTYNAKGLVERIKDDRFKASDRTYQYDDRSRVVSVTESGAYPSRTDISYDDNGRVASWTRTSQSQDASNLNYTYGTDVLEANGSSGTDEHSYKVTFDKSGNPVTSSEGTMAMQRRTSAVMSEMAYDAKGQLASCSQNYNGMSQESYAITWTDNQRISKMEKTTSAGTREGSEFIFDSAGRLERVRGLSDFDASAHSFVYDAHGLPTSWVVSTAGGDYPVQIKYKRILSSDASYKPQQVILFGTLTPSVDPDFWNPLSSCDSATSCVNRLPAMAPNLLG